MGHPHCRYAGETAGHPSLEYFEAIQDTVEKAQENGDVRYRAKDGATAYWHDDVIVIHNPNGDPTDKGSAYPADREYFEKFGDGWGPPPSNPPAINPEE
jgi:hypothetical protein